MIGRTSLHGILIAAAACLMACGSPVRQVRVIQTSDVHGYYGAPAKPDAPGGLRSLAALVEAERSSRGGILLIDSGDMWSGTLLSDRTEGQLGVRAYDVLGYDGAALGNHEFDYGPVGPRREGGDDPFGALRSRLAEADFPILAANLVDRKTGKIPDWPGLAASALVERGGIRIGLVGAITEDTPSITFPHVGDRLRFDPAGPAVIREARALRKAGAEIVLLLAHLGGGCRSFDDPDDLSSCDGESPLFELVRSLPSGLVDAAFGGHTHRAIAHRLRGVAVLQPGRYGRAVSVLDIKVSAEGRPTLTIHRPRAVDLPAVGALAQELDGLLNPAEVETAAVLDEDLGARLVRPLVRDVTRGGELGAFLCDVLLSRFPDREICIMNTGGLRADLAPGPITYGQLYELLPFGNVAAELDITGETLRELLRRSTTGTHGFPQVAGIHLTIDRRREPCPKRDRDGSGVVDVDDRDRVVEVTLADGTALDPAHTYRVLTNGFLAQGGDGWRGVLAKVHADRKRMRVDRLPVRDEIAAWLRENRPVLHSADRPAVTTKRLVVIGDEPDVRCGPVSTP